METGRFIQDVLRNSRSARRIFSLGRGAGALSISIGEKSLWVAERAVDAGGAPRERVVEFIFPADIALDDPQRLGEALTGFLSRENFSARRVIFGVPAKWMIVRPYEMPPADEQTASSILWLHATERVMPALGLMVFDFLGDSSPSQSTMLLLMGLQQHRMDQLMALARSAKLKVAGITPIGAAVGKAVGRHVPSALIALFGPGGMELIHQDGQQTKSISYVRLNGSVQPVIAELRRTAASLPVDGDLPDRSPPKLVLWDDVGANPQLIDALPAASGLAVVEVQRQWVEIFPSGDAEGARGLSASALCAQSGEAPGVDFLNPRIAPPRLQRSHTAAVWLPWAVAAVAVILLAAMTDMLSIQRQISGLDNQLQNMEPALHVARPYVQSMQFADSFRTTQPRYLACIADLTGALPPDGQTYLNNFNLHSDMTGEISGSSSGEQNILDFRDKLNATGRFTDLMCRLDAHETRGGASSVLFSVTFNYKFHK